VPVSSVIDELVEIARIHGIVTTSNGRILIVFMDVTKSTVRPISAKEVSSIQGPINSAGEK
jgi:hypothetical protein